jgi:hypothetical protein
MNPASQRLPVGSVAWLEINLRLYEENPVDSAKDMPNFVGRPARKQPNIRFAGSVLGA